MELKGLEIESPTERKKISRDESGLFQSLQLIMGIMRCPNFN